jgi:hypothetical protein
MSKPRISDFWSVHPIGFSSYIVGTMPRIRNGVVYWRIRGSIMGVRPIEAKFRWPMSEVARSYVTLYARMKVAWDETYAQAFKVAKEASERERSYLRVAPKR